MGWRQEHKEFQLEVGYANLAIGIWGLVAAVFNWGLVCGVALAIYATYLFCALLLHLSESHAWEDLHKTVHRSRAIKSVVSTGFFVIVLAGFAFIAFAHAGVLPFIHL
jgi:type VI protein secretion system component VasF